MIRMPYRLATGDSTVAGLRSCDAEQRTACDRWRVTSMERGASVLELAGQNAVDIMTPGLLSYNQ